MTAGVLMYCFNTEHYRYDKIASKTIPLVRKNLQLPVTIVTNDETKKLLPEFEGVEYLVIQNETGNKIDHKAWHNLDRYKAYSLSPYETTILMDIDYFCFTDNLLLLLKLDDDFLVHDTVYDLTGKDSYRFRKNSSIPMVWATMIVFKKTKRVEKIFQMVGYIKSHYNYFRSLYRIDFANFRNDYAFAMALQQLGGFSKYPTIPVDLPTLPASARVSKVHSNGVTWSTGDRTMTTKDTDVHVIDKGVAHV